MQKLKKYILKPVSKIMDKMPDKHVLQKHLGWHSNKLQIETWCDFHLKYLYLKGNSKNTRLVFQEDSHPETKKS